MEQSSFVVCPGLKFFVLAERGFITETLVKNFLAGKVEIILSTASLET